MEYVIASYEVVPLLTEYSPRINAQQLKHSLLSREERERVDKLIKEHGKLSADSLYAAMARFASCRGAERDKNCGAIFYVTFCVITATCDASKL